MKTVTLVMCVVLGLVGCKEKQDNAEQAAPQADYRQLAVLTMATLSRSAELFAKLGDSDQAVYYREIYNPAMQAAAMWPGIAAPEAKQVPEALWDCQEAAASWVSYLDRATMKNPPDVVLVDARKDMARVQEKTRLCDAAIK